MPTSYNTHTSAGAHVPRLVVVTPCYNESEVLPHSVPQLLAELDQLAARGLISGDSKLLLVDDGSQDTTWEVISRLAKADTRVLGIHNSSNRGQQSALLAGMMEVRGWADVVITCDCDGQDDPGAMGEMLERFCEGYEIVYAVRDSRETDSWAKRVSAQMFYRLLGRMDVTIVYDHADFRLVSAKALDTLREYGEVNLFLRGLFPIMGLRSTTIRVPRRKRLAGSTHYSLSKMFSFAFDGITSTTTRPLDVVMGFGLVVALISFVAIIWAIVSAATGHTVSGWASMTCIMCFLGGVQLISIGVIGEYVGKTYLETKQRPRYCIDERTYTADQDGRNNDDNNTSAGL